MIENATLLVADDDSDVLSAAHLILRRHFSNVLLVENPADIEKLMYRESIDVFLLDMNFAIGSNTGSEGLHWLNRILDSDPDAVVVLMTAFGDLNTAVRAMREGAADFVLKPWQNDKLITTLGVALTLRRTRKRLNALGEPQPSPNIIAGAKSMRDVLRVIARVAPTDANILIRGENGTGKELIARAVHRQSSRSNKPLVSVDLGTIPEPLFDSELFGHAKGAFSDAARDRAGRFQAAHQGTLFLDDIGALPILLQTKLLRSLERGEVVPLGSDQAVSIDVRLVAASSQPLEQRIGQGRFSEDLLYRVNTIEIKLPPLRERLDDLPALVARFVTLSARKYRLSVKHVSESALDALQAHHWPGNIRELSHTVERAMLLSDGETLDTEDFRLGNAHRETLGDSLNLDDNERYLIELALQRSKGNISHAANALGITRAALYRRIEKFGL